MTRTSDLLSESFTNYRASDQPPGIKAEVAALLANNNLSTDTLDELCVKHRTQDLSTFKTEMLDLVLFYIKCCLQDHRLSAAEKAAIDYLKGMLKIDEGDFYNFKRNETKELLTLEIIRILDDKNVDTAEALYKVDLQKLFGLSYDEFLDLTMAPVHGIVDDMIAKISADGVVTVEERTQLFQQIIALDTVYRLKPIQKKALDNLQR
jgi:hypothetical protein